MKKIIAVLMAIILVSVPFTAFAYPDFPSHGDVPKTLTAPSIDGTKEALWDNALHVPIQYILSESALGGPSDAWLLWDDENLYIFVDMKVADVSNLKDAEDYAEQEPYSFSSIEIMIDFNNDGEKPDAPKFCVVDKGYGYFGTLGEETMRGDDAKKYVEVGSKKGTTGYTAELKIKINEVKTYLTSIDSIFGSDYVAGKMIGINFFAQEVDASGATAYYLNVDRDAINAPSQFDNIVLGANTVNAAAAEQPTEPEATQPAATEPAATEPAADNGAAATEPAATQPATKPASSTKTGDNTAAVIFFITAAVALSAVVVFARKSKKTSI